MKTTPIIAAALVMCLAGCDLGIGQREARRTVTGVSPTQVVHASQRVLAAEGFDLEVAIPDDGVLRTAWLERHLSRVSCSVETGPGESPGGKAIPDALTVTILCTAQDRLVGGWSDEYPVSQRSRSFLKAITRVLISMPPAPEAPAAPPPRTPAPPAHDDGRYTESPSGEEVPS